MVKKIFDEFTNLDIYEKLHKAGIFCDLYFNLLIKDPLDQKTDNRKRRQNL